MNVNTVAVDCNIERSDGKQGSGSGDASLLEQAGGVGASFAGLLRSTVICREEGPVVRGEVEAPAEQ